MLFMKKLLPTLSAVFLAFSVAACSASSESPSDEPMFHQDSANASSSANDETSEAEDTTSDEDSDQKNSELKERDPQEFMAGGGLATFPDPVPAVRSADGRILCLIHEEAEGPSCLVEFADPPLDPRPVNQKWKSNSVYYRDDRGFIPSWAIEFYRPGEPDELATLNEGEKVTFGDITFEAPSADEFTAKVKDHHFTVKNDGEYYSDTFPLKPDEDGNAYVGTVCGTTPMRFVDEEGMVYVQEDGTNCNEAMAVIDEYLNHDWQDGEGGNRGLLTTDRGSCGHSAPKLWEDKPENRFLGCSLNSGGSFVVLTPNNMKVIE